MNLSCSDSREGEARKGARWQRWIAKEEKKVSKALVRRSHQRGFSSETMSFFFKKNQKTNLQLWHPLSLFSSSEQDRLQSSSNWSRLTWTLMRCDWHLVDWTETQSTAENQVKFQLSFIICTFTTERRTQKEKIKNKNNKNKAWY